MATRLTVRLIGGLGNQMFQYAAGRSFAAKFGAEFVLDTKTGFARDFVYKRVFELSSMPIAGRIATGPELLVPWAERLAQKISPSDSMITHRWFGDVIREPDAESFHGGVFNLDVRRSALLEGFWQSEQYFTPVADTLRRELKPAVPLDPKWERLAVDLRKDNAVAVGVRLYEEVPGASKEGVGGVTTLASIQNVAEQIARKVENPRFFVFSIHRSEQLARLKLPGSVTYVTHDDDYEGTHERIWALSQARHHLFSNSSYYWWGAWLSEGRPWNRTGQSIWAADNFLNVDGLPSRWTKFPHDLN